MINKMNTFRNWTPIENSGAGYDIQNIIHSDGKLIFVIIPDGANKKNEDTTFEIVWEFSDIVSYNIADETYRADCWGLDFKNDGRFYVSKESEYLEKLKEKSPLFPENALHFLIVGTNIIADIVAKEFPTIKPQSDFSGINHK